MSASSALAARRSLWQNPRRRRQVAAGAGVLLFGYVVLVFVALLGGPRIGASFLPLPGGGPEPASPVAGPQPGQPSQQVVVPHESASTPSATPAVPPTAVPTLLPTATKPGEVQVPDGITTTPYPTLPPGSPTPELAETTGPTLPHATRRPPTAPVTTRPPTAPPTSDPPASPTTSPITSTTPSTPPTTPDTPDNPDQPTGLGGLLGTLLHKLGL